MFTKILIANRGEIACRIARTCRRLGIRVATIHSEADRRALHVREIGESIEVGAPPAADSYLNISAIVEAAQSVGAQAVHPGIGFLSENPDFADAVEAAGLVFIGPRPETMRRFSDKWDAKREAASAHVPVIAGSQGSFSDGEAAERCVRDMRLPVLLKAAAGGGGRGVRVVETLELLRESIDSAMREAQSSFGRPDLLIEQFIDRPQHVEVQVAGDGCGNVLHLYERECSLQRRFQKIIEEAPAAGLSPTLRANVIEAAVRMAAQVKYRGVGTMEFLVAGDEYYFLECNPRLQVEHTVTEAITGVDLVELQLAIAANGALPLKQSQVKISGHAVQARLYAEDPNAGFVPSTGIVERVVYPSTDVRVDSGVTNGSEVTPYYDALIAKLVAHGSDRAEALAKLRLALEETAVLGVETNLSFLYKLLCDPTVLAGRADNRFIDRELGRFQGLSEPDAAVVAIAAEAWLAAAHPACAHDPWSGYSGWRLGGDEDGPARRPAFLLVHGGKSYEISVARHCPKRREGLAVDGVRVSIELEQDAHGVHHARLPGRALRAILLAKESRVLVKGPFGSFDFAVAPFLLDRGSEERVSGQLTAPMMGKIIQVNVAPGDSVKVNETLVVQESMKMELSISAPYDGRVVSVDCSRGDLVERNAVVVTVEPIEATL